MPGDDRGREVVREEHVAVVVGFEHVDVRAADAAGADFEDHLARPRVGGVIAGLERRFRVAVDEVGVDRPLALLVLGVDLDPLARRPLGVEDDRLHMPTLSLKWVASASSGVELPRTTAEIAATIAAGSSCWKMLRPTEQPTAPTDARRGDLLQQVEVAFARAAGDDDRDRDAIDDLGEFLGRAGPVALDDVGAELGAEAGAPLQVGQAPFGRVVVAGVVVGVGELGLGDVGHPEPVAGFADLRRQRDHVGLVLGRERDHRDDAVDAELGAVLDRRDQPLLVALAAARGGRGDLGDDPEVARLADQRRQRVDQARAR